LGPLRKLAGAALRPVDGDAVRFHVVFHSPGFTVTVFDKDLLPPA
jgi:hypothetical protein